MYVESLGPHNFGKVSFVKFGPANCEPIGNIHRESNWVFPVNSYILSRVRMKLLKSENFYSIFRTIFLSLLRQAQFKPRSFNCIIAGLIFGHFFDKSTQLELAVFEFF